MTQVSDDSGDDLVDHGRARETDRTGPGASVPSPAFTGSSGPLQTFARGHPQGRQGDRHRRAGKGGGAMELALPGTRASLRPTSTLGRSTTSPSTTMPERSGTAPARRPLRGHAGLGARGGPTRRRRAPGNGWSGSRRRPRREATTPFPSATGGASGSTTRVCGGGALFDALGVRRRRPAGRGPAAGGSPGARREAERVADQLAEAWLGADPGSFHRPAAPRPA